MTFQYIINHLHEPHLWCIVLTAPHAELNIQKKLEQQGFITYVSNDFSSAQLGRMYKRNTHPDNSKMCICICNQGRNARDAKGIYRLISANRYSLISKPINPF